MLPSDLCNGRGGRSHGGAQLGAWLIKREILQYTNTSLRFIGTVSSANHVILQTLPVPRLSEGVCQRGSSSTTIYISVSVNSTRIASASGSSSASHCYNEYGRIG